TDRRRGQADQLGQCRRRGRAVLEHRTRHPLTRASMSICGDGTAPRRRHLLMRVFHNTIVLFFRATLNLLIVCCVTQVTLTSSVPPPRPARALRSRPLEAIHASSRFVERLHPTGTV